MKKLLIFDLGETLVYFEGVKLNWSEHYERAIRYSLESVKCIAFDADVEMALSILHFYNTRINKREFEVGEGEVMSKIASLFQQNQEDFESRFFEYFLCKAIIQADVLPTLQELKNLGYSIAVLSDVPYGMPKSLVLKNLGSLVDYIDKVVSSCDVGFRKPNPKGLQLLMVSFGIPKDKTYYIGNEKKDIECAINAGVTPILYSSKGNDVNWGQVETIYSIGKLIDIL